MEKGLPVVVALVGPTGAGKTSLAIALAERLPLEVISCDSQAVYRGMDIATAKPTAEERRKAPHHLVDVADPWEDFSAARYLELADRAIEEVRGRGRLPLVVGGTGLYLRALLEGIVEAPPKDEALRLSLERRAEEEGDSALHGELARVDPEAAARIPPGDRVRIVRALEVFTLTGKPITWHHLQHRRQERYRALVLGLTPPREELYRRIDGRAGQMFEEGLVGEAASLGADPRSRRRLEACIGYREALALLGGGLSRDEALERVRREQRRYAKRQLTWFRRMEVDWLAWPPSVDQAEAKVREALRIFDEEAGA